MTLWQPLRRQALKGRFIWIAGFVIAVFCTVANSQNQASIRGQIKANDGTVIPGAKLEATNTSTHATYPALSDADGTFRFDVPVGHYSVHYSVAGFKTGTIETNANVGQATILDIIVPIAPEVLTGEIRVHVNDTQGRKAAGVTVSLTASDGQRYHGVTDAQGDYVQRSLGGGMYKVTVDSGGHPCRTIRIKNGQSISVSLKMSDHCR